MTALNKQALREAAEKALPAMKRLLMMPNDELFDEELLNVDGDVDAANAFNLIAGPETMLALLDENLQLQRNKDSLEAAALAMRDDMREAREKLESAEKRIAETNQRNTELTAKIEPMDRRIAELRDWNAGLAQESFTYQQRVAELEARTITVKFEPIPMEELGNRRDGKKHPYMFGAGYNSAVVHCESVLHQACAAAGIGVKQLS